MEQPFKLNWIEILIAIISLIIAVVYGSLMIIEISKNNIASISISNEKFIHTGNFLNQTRDIFIGVIALLGGIKIFQKKAFGWSVAAFITTLLLAISLAFFWQSVKVGSWDLILFASIFASVIFLFLSAYVWLKPTREKWKVAVPNYIIFGIMVAMVAILLYA